MFLTHLFFGPIFMIGKFLIDSLFASVVPPHRVDVSVDFFEEGLSSCIFFLTHKRHASFCRGSCTVKEKGDDAFYTTNFVLHHC